MTNPVGRPSGYSPEIADLICEHIAAGGSLNKLIQDSSKLSNASVFRWLEKYEDFREKYARAREMQGDTHFDLIVDIADEATPETVQVDKLRIDARKWAASKLKPKKYGDKLTHANDEENPINHNVYTDRQVARAILELLHEANKEPITGGGETLSTLTIQDQTE